MTVTQLLTPESCVIVAEFLVVTGVGDRNIVVQPSAVCVIVAKFLVVTLTMSVTCVGDCNTVVTP